MSQLLYWIHPHHHHHHHHWQFLRAKKPKQTGVKLNQANQHAQSYSTGLKTQSLRKHMWWTWQ